MYEEISLPIFLKVKLTKIFQGQSSLNVTNTKFFSITVGTKCMRKSVCLFF